MGDGLIREGLGRIADPSAPPDFLLNPMALNQFHALFLRKGARAPLSSAALKIQPSLTGLISPRMEEPSTTRWATFRRSFGTHWNRRISCGGGGGPQD